MVSGSAHSGADTSPHAVQRRSGLAETGAGVNPVPPQLGHASSAMVLGPLISARVHLRCEYARRGHGGRVARRVEPRLEAQEGTFRSEEHTSELQSLMRTSSAVFCLQKKKKATMTIRETKTQ